MGKQRCFADLYYKSARLAVEYDSHAFHSSPYEQGKDALRAALMERNGIETRSLSTIQLYDKHACKNFAFNLARQLDKRIRIRAKDFELMHAELRKLFPDGGTLK